MVISNRAISTECWFSIFFTSSICRDRGSPDVYHLLSHSPSPCYFLLHFSLTSCSIFTSSSSPGQPWPHHTATRLWMDSIRNPLLLLSQKQTQTIGPCLLSEHVCPGLQSLEDKRHLRHFFCCCRVHRVQINIPVNYLSPCQRLYSLKVSERSIWLQSQHQLMSGQCGLIFFARSMFSGDFYFLFFPNLWRRLTDLNYYHSVDQFFFLCPNHCR